MKKAERMQQLKNDADKDLLKQIKQKAEDAGLGFVKYELPPDEVTEKDVRRNIVTSLLSMVPYSNAWYESRAAEDEMDDLRKIRVEKVKAADLLTMSKIGQHDEALERMMAETNYDFFYFNKLKTKMIAEGKFTPDDPLLANPFAAFGKGVNRNRLRKAVNANYSLLDDNMTQELARLSSMPSDQGSGSTSRKKFDKDQPCIWRGRSKTGENLKCTNNRMVRVRKSADGSKAKEDILQWCCFHNPLCVGETHVGATAQGTDEVVKIKVPNAESLCSECYMIRIKQKPLPLTAEVCPGVIVISLHTVGKSVKAQSAGLTNNAESKASYKSSKGKNQNVCGWCPSPNNVAMRAYECTNEQFVDPVTLQRLGTCAWHLTKCVLVHPPGSNSTIAVPNIYGLCAMHYLAQHGSAVEETPFPFPNMRVKKSRDFWKSVNGATGQHWAAPRSEPLENVVLREYEEAEKASDFIQQMVLVHKQLIFVRRRKREGHKCAAKIQAFFRRYRKVGMHNDFKFARLRQLRFFSSVMIQSQMRRFLRSKFMDACRKKYNAAALVVQRVFRGHRCRSLLRVAWAARRIQKFMKKLHFFKFKDAVIMIMQLRLLARKQHRLAVVIQRVFRGHSTRIWVFNKRLWNFICIVSARKIQRFYKREHARRALVPFVYPGEAWVRQQCAKKLSRMLLEMFLDRTRRLELAALMQRSAPNIQKLIRGFLAKSGARKMAFLRSSFRSWFHPQFAAEFMDSFLRSKLLNVTRVETLPLPMERSRPCFVRAHLPELKRGRYEVDRRAFEAALESWYHSLGIPLVQSEKQAIYRKFKNPMNGNVAITLLDQFIAAHPLPCRRHGRTICGDCVLRRDCMLGRCHCKCFVAAGPKDKGICVTCSHPGSLHVLVPTQARDKANAKNKTTQSLSMLKIMTADREPDMSLPTALTGVEAAKVIIPPPHPDDIRLGMMRTQRTDSLARSAETSAEPWSVEKAVSRCQIAAETIADNLQYWEQRTNSVVSPRELLRKEAIGSDPFVYEPVVYDSHRPAYEAVTPSVFWSLAAKNPLKRVRDYHEKFDHNMPVPVVSHGEVVYSFEGPAIYLNVLSQIIAMERSVDHDNPDFLRLVVDHIQIFERHWRKLVVDIRNGKLDRNLEVSVETRQIFESTNLPRPKLADKLDLTFRHLGFHNKVLGKDIVIQPYASLRHPEARPARESELSVFTRKNSEPLLRPLSRCLSRGSTVSSNPSVSAERVGSPALLKKSPSKRDALLALGKSFRAHTAELEASASRPSTTETKRRGSQSDAQRPASRQEVNALHYGQETAARDKYHHALKVDGDRFICPFPACGKSFHSKQAAFNHLPVHEQRTRLYAPTPLPDSHLNFYWPQDVPWLTAKQYSTRAIPPGSLKCTAEGCMEAFTSQAKLSTHLRLVHMKVSDSSLSLGYFCFGGEAVCVPPNAPTPDNIPLSYCALHTLPVGKCHQCVAVEASKGPKPPFKFYPSVEIDFEAKRSLLAHLNKSGTVDSGAVTKVTLQRDDWSVGVVVSVHMNAIDPKVECKGRPLAMLQDRDHLGWLAVELLFTQNEAHARGLTLPLHMRKRRELVQPMLLQHPSLSEEEVLNRYFRWVPLSDVQRVFHLRKTSRQDMEVSLSATHVSKSNTFYVCID